jgi:hypothetical protein
MARLRCQSYQAKVDGHWPSGSSWQTGHFASAIWKFLLGFALATTRQAEAMLASGQLSTKFHEKLPLRVGRASRPHIDRR